MGDSIKASMKFLRIWGLSTFSALCAVANANFWKSTVSNILDFFSAMAAYCITAFITVLPVTKIFPQMDSGFFSEVYFSGLKCNHG